MRKRRANTFPPIPCKVEEFDNLLKNPDFGRNDGNIFYRTFASANDEFALIFQADIDLSFLNGIHSIHVDATFKTVPADFYPLLIIHCLVLTTIIPVFYVLMFVISSFVHQICIWFHFARMFVLLPPKCVPAFSH